MDLLLVTEQRFFRTADGDIWAPIDPTIWERYLSHFSRVCLLARQGHADDVQHGWNRVGRRDVEVVPLAYYVGSAGFLRNLRTLRRQVREASKGTEAVILRLPSMIGTLLHRRLKRSGRPYGVEVVGDPADVFARGAISHPLRPLLRWWSVARLEEQCLGAAAAAYVTRAALQARYPAHPSARSVWYTDAELTPDWYVAVPRVYHQRNAPLRLTTVASLEQPYKGVDVLIEALRRAIHGGSRIRLTVVGDGRLRGAYERQAIDSGLSEAVSFVGLVPPVEGVRAVLAETDCFILASRTEGLPRAIIEAMAQAVPCIATSVGGVPELLPPEDLVPPGDVAALAAAIEDVAGDPGRLTRMSAENLQRARQYESEAMKRSRDEFYSEVKAATARWRSRQSS
jgi:glycosyltransferase involved in cell wall biosynthesis